MRIEVPSVDLFIVNPARTESWDVDFNADFRLISQEYFS